MFFFLILSYAPMILFLYRHIGQSFLRATRKQYHNVAHSLKVKTRWLICNMMTSIYETAFYITGYTYLINFGVKLLIHSQTSMAVPLQFGDYLVISSHILLICDYLSMLGLKLIHFSKRGHRTRTFDNVSENVIEDLSVAPWPIGRTFILNYYKFIWTENTVRKMGGISFRPHNI